MIDVDNTKPEDYLFDCEPDMASYKGDNDFSNTNPKGSDKSALNEELENATN